MIESLYSWVWSVSSLYHYNWESMGERSGCVWISVWCAVYCVCVVLVVVVVVWGGWVTEQLRTFSVRYGLLQRILAICRVQIFHLWVVSCQRPIGIQLILRDHYDSIFQIVLDLTHVSLWLVASIFKINIKTQKNESWKIVLHPKEILIR